MTEFPKPTPDQIRAARTKAGLSQEEAAALIQVSASAWAKWEQRERGMMPVMFAAFKHMVGLETLPTKGS